MIVEELTEGLPGFTKDVEELNEDTSEFKAINPPTTRDNQKTAKKRKIQRRLRNEARQRMNAKIEKKKISDLYRYIIYLFVFLYVYCCKLPIFSRHFYLHLLISRLRYINEELDNIEILSAKKKIKRLQKRQISNISTKRLGSNKFSQSMDAFSLPQELKGTLRESQPQGNILKDCFESLQKRNLLSVGKKQLKYVP